MLMASTVTKTISPGKTASQGAVNTCAWASFSMEPQDAVGGCRPRPRKLSVDSARIALATPRVPATMMGLIEFGSRCRVAIRHRRTPRARAASTNSRSRRARNEARVSRATFIQRTRPTMTTIVRKLGPNRALARMSRNRSGSDSMRSTSRMRTLSSQPRKKPASPPTSTPSSKATTVASAPTASDTRPPASTRVRVSRPSSSVPIGWPSEGPCRRSEMFWPTVS